MTVGGVSRCKNPPHPGLPVPVHLNLSPFVGLDQVENKVCIGEKANFDENALYVQATAFAGLQVFDREPFDLFFAVDLHGRNNFKIWDNNYVSQEFIQTLKGDHSASNQLEDQIVYHDYYSNGKLKESSKADDVRSVYIWGYYQTLLLARIDNTAYDDFSTATIAAIADVQAKSNTDDDTCPSSGGCNEQTLRDALQGLSP